MTDYDRTQLIDGVLYVAPLASSIDNNIPFYPKPDLSVGTKLDVGKLRYDLIPPEALEALAEILTLGSIKYSDRNWEKGMKWGRVFGAMMRHAWSWWRGQTLDPESGKSHMWHVLCNAAFLTTYEARKIGEDDRGTSN